MIDTQLIKERISCLEYCSRMGVRLDRNNRGVSPLRPDAKNKNSFFVSDSFYFDHGANSGGDVIDLCAALEFGGDKGQAISKLAGLTGVDDDHSYDNWVKYTQNLCNQIQKWHEALRPEDIEYLHSRRINDETIKRLKIGYNGRLVIPYWKNGYVSYYITRALKDGPHPENKYMKAKLDGLNENIPFGMHTLDRENKMLVIAEGCFDVLSFEQEGYCVLGTLGGHFNQEQLKTVRNVCKQYEKVFVVFDNDNAGNSFSVTMAKFLFKNSIEFVVGSIPAKYKDVSDVYADGGDLQSLIENAEDGLIALCRSFTDRNEFAQFAYQVSRRMSKADLALFFIEAAKHLPFEKEWLQEVKKSCMASPSQQVIADEVVDKYKLKYNAKLGFMEYCGKCWNRIPDEKVQGYIREALGRYSTGSALTNVLKIIKTMVLTDELFNQNQIMNFINGTLELEPEIKFREQREDDNCTYCLPYPYDPTKRPEDWEKFIESVTDGDPIKMALLQEIAAYPLFNTNFLHKACCLIGGGRNGKSVYLEAIEKIYGDENRTTVSMSSLTKDFQVIHLMNSMINVSGEVKSDISGAEDVFKTIVAGGTISACYKGKDYVEFVPRSKFIMSCNSFPSAKDTSDGWLERWTFVKFPLHFVDDPKLPHERKKDVSLTSKFKSNEQLTAIFNWVLEGYKVLRVTKKFSEPEDEKQLVEDYRETLDPLVVFVKEFELPAPTYSIDNNDFYKAYTYWCDESNHHAMARNSFSKRVAPLITEYRRDIEKYRTSSGRGYRKVKEAEPVQETMNVANGQVSHSSVKCTLDFECPHKRNGMCDSPSTVCGFRQKAEPQEVKMPWEQ